MDAGIDAGLPWWNAAWTQRQQLTVNNLAATRLDAGFQLGWPTNLPALIGAGSQEQVRIVRWNGATWSELPRVIDDHGGTQQWIWVPLAGPINAASADPTYYLYFGNPAAGTAPGTPATVFDFSDPLNATLGGAWLNQNGYNIIGSELALAFDQSIRTSQSWGPGFAVDFLLRQPSYAGRFWGGFQIAGTFSATHPWIIWIARNTTSPAQIWSEFCEVQPTILEGSPRLTMSTVVHRYGIDRVSDRIVFRYDDVPVFNTPLPGPYSALLNVRFTNESSGTIYVSKMRVRQTVYPFPTVTSGPIEP